MDSIERLKAAPRRARPPTRPRRSWASMQRRDPADEETAKALLKEIQESMPEHQQFLTCSTSGEQKATQIRTMQEKICELRHPRRGRRSTPSRSRRLITEPTVPVRPNRLLNIALGLVLSFGLGIGLVCLLEHLDHSVKVPEHLTMGLTLPLFGVVPRIRRTALIHRGGHLWTPRRARFDRGRRLPQPPRQPDRVVGPARADRDPAGHQRQGGRGEEHDGPEPGRHLRPRRRADPADGRRPPPPEPGRRLPRGRRRGRSSAWSTCSGAIFPGSGRWSGPTSPTSTSCRPATPATSRSRSWARSNSGSC